MAGRDPEEGVPLPVMRQAWRTFTFLHWPVEPAVVRALLPSPLAPDTWDGQAWVSLTPFRLVGARPPGLPRRLGLSFPETNLRTYARLPDGRDALWFLSLEAASTTTVLGGRVGTALPYHLAEMAVDDDEGSIRYRSRRRGPGSSAGHDIVVRPGPPLAPDEVGELDHWLAGRWRAVARPLGRLTTVPVHHQPWPLHAAEVEQLDEDLFRAAGLARPAGPPLARFSPGVDARFGLPRPAPR